MLHRTLIVMMLFSMAAALPGCGATGEHASADPAQRQAEARFAQRIDVDYQQTPLRDVLDDLAQRTQLNLVVNWKALDAAGVTPDEPVDLKLTALPARQVLALVLNHLNAGLEPLAFSLHDAVLHVSTRRDINRHTETLVYDIRDMLVGQPRGNEAPEFDLNAALG